MTKTYLGVIFVFGVGIAASAIASDDRYECVVPLKQYCRVYLSTSCILEYLQLSKGFESTKSMSSLFVVRIVSNLASVWVRICLIMFEPTTSLFCIPRLYAELTLSFQMCLRTGFFLIGFINLYGSVLNTLNSFSLNGLIFFNGCLFINFRPFSSETMGLSVNTSGSYPLSNLLDSGLEDTGLNERSLLESEISSQCGILMVIFDLICSEKIDPEV